MPYMVVVANGGSERTCRAEVRDAGFVTYQPQYKEAVARRGRKIWVERLLLGRYFFVKVLQDCNWRAIFELRRVAGIIMQVDRPLPSLVPDAEIERIRRSEDRSGFVVVPQMDRLFKGQAVSVLSGVLAGHQGTFIGEGRNGCEAALIELFGQPSRVEFRPGVLVGA